VSKHACGPEQVRPTGNTLRHRGPPTRCRPVRPEYGRAIDDPRLPAHRVSESIGYGGYPPADATTVGVPGMGVKLNLVRYVIGFSGKLTAGSWSDGHESGVE
jgi:hypothetical protein